jgi:hypothetical protein
VLFARYHLFTLWLVPTRIYRAAAYRVRRVVEEEHLPEHRLPHRALITVGLLILFFTLSR